MNKAPFKVGDRVAVDPQREYFSPYVRNTIMTVTKVMSVIDGVVIDDDDNTTNMDGLGWFVECDKTDSNHGTFNSFELIPASMLRYRIEGDLPALDCKAWLHGSKLAHDDETLYLNWRIVNNDGRTMVAFAGGAGRAIADFTCTAMNKGELFNKET